MSPVKAQKDRTLHGQGLLIDDFEDVGQGHVQNVEEGKANAAK